MDAPVIVVAEGGEDVHLVSGCLCCRGPVDLRFHGSSVHLVCSRCRLIAPGAIQQRPGGVLVNFWSRAQA